MRARSDCALNARPGSCERKKKKPLGDDHVKTVKIIHPPRGGRISTNAERREQLGISKKQDEQWQKLGAIPQENFDHAVAESGKPTTAGIIRANAEPKQKPVSEDALWLWGRLRDFHSSGMLDKDPRDVMLTMTDQMRDQVHVFAPRLAAWLRRIGAVAS